MRARYLKLIYENLKKKESAGKKIKYFVPNFWAAAGDSVNFKKPEKLPVNPYGYYKEQIERILNFKVIERRKSGDKFANLVIYNSFIRASAAFDHNDDGLIGANNKDITLNKDGIRETGTFLKAIAQLGHIQRLGCNCVYLLPITKIGRFGNKGNLGSPYAIKNPYEIDERLADTLIDNDVNEQFKAFMEACHLLGIKVVVEFAFRTASRDSDWAVRHPDWFYWIGANLKDRKNSKDKKGYGSPVFENKVLQKIKAHVKKGDLYNLPEPPRYYKDFYALPPDVKIIHAEKNGKLTGISHNAELRTLNAVRVTLPGAFADWPPDDVQPPWTDVTYLRMYKHKNKCEDYNYMAYNTIRMYEKKLAKDEYANKPLWKKIEEVIPYYQNEFGIDGVLIDMGHAMPKKLMARIISAAKKNKKDFLFLSENFSVSEESRLHGYHAVMGFSWGVLHDKNKIGKLLKQAGAKNIPVKFLATGENHDTPRSAARKGGARAAKNAFLISAFIPNGILFIHSGFEASEVNPLNTGLDFTPEEIKHYKNKPLGLFDAVSYNWLNKNNIIKYIQDLMYLRDDYKEILSLPAGKSYKILKLKNKNIVGFVRYGRKDGKKTALMVLINYSKKKEKFKIDVSRFSADAAKDYPENKRYKIKGKYFKGALGAFEGKVFAVK